MFKWKIDKRIEVSNINHNLKDQNEMKKAK